VEQPGTITDNGSTLELETDSGGGFIGGAWQFWENLHLFGEYSSASQDLEVSDGVDTVEGDFDVVRWRIGVGYAYPFSPTTAFYGRVSFDNAELKDVQVPGFNLDTDIDEDGIGRWYFRPGIALVTGYEYGQITTWNVGVRFSF